MMPKEKWERLRSPKTFEDYGLSLNESELRTFPEGREVLLEIRLKQRRDKQASSFIQKAGEMARQTQERMIMNILRGI